MCRAPSTVPGPDKWIRRPAPIPSVDRYQSCRSAVVESPKANGEMAKLFSRWVGFNSAAGVLARHTAANRRATGRCS